MATHETIYVDIEEDNHGRVESATEETAHTNELITEKDIKTAVADDDQIWELTAVFENSYALLKRTCDDFEIGFPKNPAETLVVTMLCLTKEFYLATVHERKPNTDISYVIDVSSRWTDLNCCIGEILRLNIWAWRKDYFDQIIGKLEQILGSNFGTTDLRLLVDIRSAYRRALKLENLSSSFGHQSASTCRSEFLIWNILASDQFDYYNGKIYVSWLDSNLSFVSVFYEGCNEHRRVSESDKRFVENLSEYRNILRDHLGLTFEKYDARTNSNPGSDQDHTVKLDEDIEEKPEHEFKTVKFGEESICKPKSSSDEEHDNSDDDEEHDNSDDDEEHDNSDADNE